MYQIEGLLETLKQIDQLVKSTPFAEESLMKSNG
jgi:hypothetical protein